MYANGGYTGLQGLCRPRTRAYGLVLGYVTVWGLWTWCRYIGVEQG